MSSEVLVLGPLEQRVGVAAHAGATRAPHAVRVRVDVARYRVVDHRPDVRDVQASGWGRRVFIARILANIMNAKDWMDVLIRRHDYIFLLPYI